jgi:redox-sensing transcriptional repressor
MALLLRTDRIPRAAIQRLAVYLQVLERMARDRLDLVSSETLARSCGLNASQIRKDLTYFGEFGVRGVGYMIEPLIRYIRQALGADRPWDCLLVGVGNLGRALLNHRQFSRRRYNIVGAFDSEPRKIGVKINDIEVACVRRIVGFVAERKVDIGIITTPPEAAQNVADELIAAGIKGILNYASAHIFVPEGVFVEYVDFFNHLYALSFNISQTERGC